MNLRETAEAGRKPLFWFVLAAVLVLAMVPPSVPTPTTGWDKSNHLLAFSVLTILARMAYPGPAWPRLLGLLAYGVVIEILQGFTSYRSSDWTDVVADTVGIAVGWALVAVADLTLRRRPQ